MQIYLYKFNKRPNSTAQPLPTAGKAFTVQVKNECSFITPVLRFTPDNLTTGVFSPSAYNYAQIAYWQRFYYITDWTYINGSWEATLSVDVLASFKSEIGSTSAYIIRSASHYNGDITDTFYPSTTVKSITKQQISSNVFQQTIPSGCFILGCINNDTSGNKMGAVTYYALTMAQMTSVLQYLFSSNIYQNSNIYEIGEGLYKSLFDPFQYIVSCMWFPFAASDVGNTTSTVSVGYWSTGVTGLIATYIVKEFGGKTNLAIERHPQIARGAYMDHAPYTTLTAFYPPFGEIPLDTSFMQYGANNYLYCKMYVDFITGIADGYFTITNGYDTQTTADPYKYMTLRSAQIGVPIQISQVMSDYIGAIGGAANVFASAAGGNVGGIFSGIATAVQEAMPKVSSLGANGSLVEIVEPPYLIVEHSQVVDENLAEFGRPLCNTKTISTLSGYVLCGEDDHSFSGTKTENEEINRYLKTGFFYE